MVTRIARPVDAGAEGVPGLDDEPQRFEPGPVAGERDDDRLERPRLDHDVRRAGVVEHQRDSGCVRVGEVGQDEVVGLVDDVLALAERGVAVGGDRLERHGGRGVGVGARGEDHVRLGPGGVRVVEARDHLVQQGPALRQRERVGDALPFGVGRADGEVEPPGGLGVELGGLRRARRAGRTRSRRPATRAAGRCGPRVARAAPPSSAGCGPPASAGAPAPSAGRAVGRSPTCGRRGHRRDRRPAAAARSSALTWSCGRTRHCSVPRSTAAFAAATRSKLAAAGSSRPRGGGRPRRCGRRRTRPRRPRRSGASPAERPARSRASPQVTRADRRRRGPAPTRRATPPRAPRAGVPRGPGRVRRRGGRGVAAGVRAVRAARGAPAPRRAPRGWAAGRVRGRPAGRRCCRPGRHLAAGTSTTSPTAAGAGTPAARGCGCGRRWRARRRARGPRAPHRRGRGRWSDPVVERTGSTRPSRRRPRAGSRGWRPSRVRGSAR